MWATVTVGSLPCRRREQQYLASEEAARPALKFSEWLALFKRRTTRGMILGFSGVNYTGWLYIAWLPGYLQAQQGLSLARTGWVAAIPFLAAAVGMWVNGLVVDALARRGYDQAKTRKTAIVIGLVLSALGTLLVVQSSTPAQAVAFISMALFCVHFAGTSAWGLVQVMVAEHKVASVAAHPELRQLCVCLLRADRDRLGSGYDSLFQSGAGDRRRGDLCRGRCATSLSSKLASISNARRFVNSRPAGTRGRHVLLLPLPALSCHCGDCSLVPRALSRKIFLYGSADRNQRCYTNCVRWLRHKGILLESSPREWLMGYITTRVIMENTLLTANATLPTYDRSALIPVSFILVLARFIALIRLCMPIYWPASTAATGATPKLI